MLQHKGTVTLHTPRLTLRKITDDDAQEVYTWMSDPAICRYERFTPHDSVDYTRGYIHAVTGGYAAETVYFWGIEKDGRLIGSICVVGVEEHDQKASFGYSLAQAHWGQGYATEAARAVVAFMFEEVNLHRIEASHAIDNPASGRVLEKAGLLLEGRAKDYFLANAGYQDSKLYGLTRDDYGGEQVKR